MKKLLLLTTIVVIMFLCFACSNKPVNLKTASFDNADIYYGYVSHALIHVDTDTTKDLVNSFSHLSFEPTNDEIDTSTMIKVYFYHNKSAIASVSVDEDGVFNLSGKTGAYKASPGSFNYENLRDIYYKSSININVENADDVTIFYGVSSYGMFGADNNTLKELTSQFSRLSLKPTDDKIDFPTMLMIVFYHNGDVVASANVDKNGVFRIGENYYKDASGSFNYALVKKIYDESKYK